MSLATRCPACQTVFRVVQDQLRVSEGWVRCGRCAEVFNALEHMVEVAKPAGAVPQAPPVAAVAPAAVPAAAPTAAAPESLAAVQMPPGTPDLSDGAEQAALDPSIVATSDGVPAGLILDGTQSLDADDEHSVAVPMGESPPAEPALVESDLALSSLLDVRPGAQGAHEVAQAMVEPSAAEPVAVAPAQITSAAPPAEAAQATTADPPPLPSFLRNAERAERWRRPAVRRALAAVFLLGLIGLVLQVSVTYRDLIAARWPESRLALVPLCQALGCRIEQPRWIEAVVVDSTGLTRVEGTATYKLQVVLRNRSGMALALPWLDLSLTDIQGRLVARRALSPQQLGSTAPALAAHGELTLQVALAVGDKGSSAVSGYTIEVFYP